MSYSFLKEGGRPFIIAEAGINHNGDLKLALDMVKKAAIAGADAIKFQNFDTKDFIFDRSVSYTYQNKNRQITERLWDICKRCEMQKGWVRKLKRASDKIGIEFICTPTSKAGVKELVSSGVGILKNGSDYLYHTPLLEYMGSTGLLILISTGMAYENEIQDAIDAVKRGGKSPIVIMHCTSSYPTDIENTNLNRITSIKKRFNLPVGFSDHTEGFLAAIEAVALGATVFEKHFTLDPDMPGPDHRFSLNPSGFKMYVQEIRKAKKRLGKGAIKPAASEKQNRNNYMLSLIAKRCIKKGKVLKLGDFVIAKPGTGLPPKEINNVIGKRLVRNIQKGTPLKWEYLG